MSSSILKKGLNADLENFDLTDIMQLITQQVKCGILSVENGSSRCSWIFNDGKLINFDCHFPDFTLDLESILLKSGQLTRTQLEQLHKKHEISHPRELEQALLRERLLSREKLEAINLRRLLETFIITLQWSRGHYQFIPTGEVGEEGFFPPQDTNFVMLEALRQIDEMAVMKQRLEPLERVFETTLTLALDSEDLDSEERRLIAEGLRDQFNRDELEVYQLFDGRRSLEEILNSSSLGQSETCRIILDFLARGIIAPSSTIADPLPGAAEQEENIGLLRHSPALVMLLLTLALGCSILLSVAGCRPGREPGKPAFIRAILENLKAEQEKARCEALKLLPEYPAPPRPQ